MVGRGTWLGGAGRTGAGCVVETRFMVPKISSVIASHATGGAAALQLAEVARIAAGAAGAQHGELSGGAKVHLVGQG